MVAASGDEITRDIAFMRILILFLTSQASFYEEIRRSFTSGGCVITRGRKDKENRDVPRGQVITGNRDDNNSGDDDDNKKEEK